LTAALTLGWREARQLAAAVVQIYKALGGGWEVEVMADRDLPRGKAGSVLHQRRRQGVYGPQRTRDETNEEDRPCSTRQYEA